MAVADVLEIRISTRARKRPESQNYMYLKVDCCRQNENDIIVIKEIFYLLSPFCKQNFLLFIQPKCSEEHISLITIMFCFNEFAFTVQVKHKINSTQILGFILICFYFTTGHLHTRVLCK